MIEKILLVASYFPACSPRTVPRNKDRKRIRIGKAERKVRQERKKVFHSDLWLCLSANIFDLRLSLGCIREKIREKGGNAT